eukprot:6204262-Pleurochrysis_carterae.AAC.3
MWQLARLRVREEPDEEARVEGLLLGDRQVHVHLRRVGEPARKVRERGRHVAGPCGEYVAS